MKKGISLGDCRGQSYDNVANASGRWTLSIGQVLMTFLIKTIVYEYKF